MSGAVLAHWPQSANVSSLPGPQPRKSKDLPVETFPVNWPTQNTHVCTGPGPCIMMLGVGYSDGYQFLGCDGPLGPHTETCVPHCIFRMICPMCKVNLRCWPLVLEGCHVEMPMALRCVCACQLDALTIVTHLSAAESDYFQHARTSITPIQMSMATGSRQ